MQQAGVTDDQINQKFSANQEGFQLLSKTRAELAAMVPASQGAQQFESDPTIVAIKELLNQLETIRQGKEKVMNDGVAMHDQLNATEELMKVNSGQAAKGEVFESYKAKYTQHFAQNEAFEQQKHGIAQQISQHGPQLSQVLARVGNDPAKNQFFMKISEAIMVADQLQMLIE